MKKTGAGLARHRSKQDIGTPPEFIEAVERRFGRLAWDLAANRSNHVTQDWFGPGGAQENSLECNWKMLLGNLWLNPPFGYIDPWALRCAQRWQDRRWMLLLVPAAVGSNWFHDIVAPRSYVLELRDRITFVGESHGYPKDLLLCCFGFGMVGRGAWHWDLGKKKRTAKRFKED